MNTMRHLPKPETLTAFLALLVYGAALQASDTARWSWGFYGEAYFQRDAGSETRPAFIYSHHRNGTAATNLALFQVSRVGYRTSFHAGLMDGTYARTNLSAEPRLLQHVFEARLAWKPVKEGRAWLEAGVFPSHIGNESAIGNQCATLTRSLMADNSPYYESGLRWLQTSRDGKREGGLYLLNGWQRMRLPEKGVFPALGHQLTWQLRPRLRVNSSSFVGNPGERANLFRVFHDAWVAWNFHPDWSVLTAFDIGWQRNAGHWQTGSAVLRYQVHEHWALAGRAEWFHDPEGIILTGSSGGRKVVAASLNVDYKASAGLLWRAECRWLQTPFDLADRSTRDLISFNTALCFQIP
jgi:hypothetical protein